MKADYSFFQGLGHDELTGNLQAMPTRKVPMDAVSEYEITCGKGAKNDQPFTKAYYPLTIMQLISSFPFILLGEKVNHIDLITQLPFCSIQSYS